jgi:glycosyltransferase involved in cell wall biosynthesis
LTAERCDFNFTTTSVTQTSLSVKILVVHNDYGKYSGEESVVDRFIADAQEMGHEVETLRLTSKQYRESISGKIKGFFSGLYSIQGVRMMRQRLKDFRPDVVNVHNLYPFISPAALKECKKVGVPVVMTVHNYRLICPTGLFLREGKPCEECLDKGNENSCIKHNCEHSLFRSIGYAMRNKRARKKRYYLDNINYYCCLTQFQKEKLIQGGFDADKIVVIPNYTNIPPEETSQEKAEQKDRYIGYVGRLSYEKGYDLLLQVAYKHPELHFRFAGEARDSQKQTIPNNVEFCGVLSHEQLIQFYRHALFIVIPSRCYEGFPVVLLEASSYGRPCIVPNHGAFPQLINNGEETCGVVFTPNNPDDLEEKIIHLYNEPETLAALGRNALKNIRDNYSKEKVIASWQNLLHRATL